MRSRMLFLVMIIVMALVPGIAAAQNGTEDDDFLLRVNGPVTIGANEETSTVVVISGDATVDGTIREALVVIDGKATVSGRVDGEITVVGGDLELVQGATVENVSLINSDLVRADGVTVTGEISDESWSWSAFDEAVTAFSILFWIGMTITVLLAAALFALLGGRQLTDAVAQLSERPAGVVLTALAVWIGLPILAILAFLSVVGIPIGLAILFFLIPALWFFGYLTLGTWVGTILLGLAGRRTEGEHPYLAAIGGVFLLQLVALIPFLGGLVLFLGGPLGAGALIYRLVRGHVRQTPVGEARSPLATPANV